MTPEKVENLLDLGNASVVLNPHSPDVAPNLRALAAIRG
jgi:hypothetical protein